MSNKEYGSYHYRESAYINEANLQGSSLDSIIVHETTHRNSFIDSTFGMFYRMWKKLLDVPEFRKSKPLFDCLQKYFEKMQEQAATYTEIVAELSELDTHEYSQYISGYREQNKKYYNYYNGLILSSKGVLGVGNIKKINSSQNTDKLYYIIDEILRLSFSIDVTKFNVEKWKKVSDVEANISQNCQLNPNTRFKTILKALEYSEEKSCIILNQEALKKIEIVDYDNYDLEKYLDIFVKLFGKENETFILNLIVKSGVETDKEIITDKALLVYPDLSAFISKKNVFLNKLEMVDDSILLSNKMDYKYVMIITQLNFSLWSAMLINETKISLMPNTRDKSDMTYNIKFINELIQNSDLIVTTQSKLPMRIIKKIKSEIIIFMSRSVSENLRYIKDEYSSGNYNFVKYNDLNFLIVKKDSALLIQPLISSQIDLVLEKMDAIANRNVLMSLPDRAIGAAELHSMDRQANSDEEMSSNFYKNLSSAMKTYYISLIEK